VYPNKGSAEFQENSPLGKMQFVVVFSFGGSTREASGLNELEQPKFPLNV
jgi:hypothetical protein